MLTEKQATKRQKQLLQKWKNCDIFLHCKFVQTKQKPPFRYFGKEGLQLIKFCFGIAKFGPFAPCATKWLAYKQKTIFAVITNNCLLLAYSCKKASNCWVHTNCHKVSTNQHKSGGLVVTFVTFGWVCCRQWKVRRHQRRQCHKWFWRPSCNCWAGMGSARQPCRFGL